MDQQEVETLFARWWVESYGSIPGPHARMTHAAFAIWLLEKSAPDTAA